MASIGRHVSRLSGYAPAVPMPFCPDGKIDGSRFEQFCDLLIDAGATALAVCATTGEGPTLTPDEHRTLTRIAACVASGRVPVIAGAGSNCTADAIALARQVEAAGADAILSVVPYYNKPMQAGLAAHFAAIAAATGLPVILHDVPERSVVGLADETVARLAALPRIIGLKDATGDTARPARLRRLVGEDFRLLSGDDTTAFAFLAHGGDGCISGAANLVPGLCRSMYLECKQGQITRAQRLAAVLAPLAALLRDGSPAPLKYALSLRDLIPARMRLPLVEPGEPTKDEIAIVLARISETYPEGVIGGSLHKACRMTGDAPANIAL